MLWIDEWFRGLRPHFWAKSYPLIYMIRCLFISSYIYATYDDNISSFAMVFQTQASYTAYINIIRPFEEKLMNHLDGWNNIIASILLLLLFFYDTEEAWTRAFTVFYIVVIILTLIANLVVTFSKIIILIHIVYTFFWFGCSYCSHCNPYSKGQT
jgi:hypothetical protein